MAHEIPRDANAPSDGTEQDFSALADQWADKNWYLPPGGDHSWREQEARRRFGGIASEANPSPVASDIPAPNEMDGSYDPGFKRAWALNILLPAALATCAAFVIVAFLAPGLLSSGYWGPGEPKAPANIPVRVIDAAGMVDNAVPRLASGGSPDRDMRDFVRQALPQPIGQAVVPSEADREMVLPQLRTQVPITAKPELQSDKPAARIAKEAPPPARPSKKTVVKSLPPIGAAYFASHVPAARASAVAVKKSGTASSRPIGQAYFESHSSATAD